MFPRVLFLSGANELAPSPSLAPSLAPLLNASRQHSGNVPCSRRADETDKTEKTEKTDIHKDERKDKQLVGSQSVRSWATAVSGQHRRRSEESTE